jgi:hypothetical protein
MSNVRDQNVKTGHSLSFVVTTTTTTTERPLPPWMRKRPTTSSTTTTTSTTTESSSSTTPPVGEVSPSSRKRVPITLPPNHTGTPPSNVNSNSGNGNGGSGAGKRPGKKESPKNIVNRFLSSSISSTNIMDTSEVPVTLIGEEEKEAAVTTTTAAPPPALISSSVTRAPKKGNDIRTEISTISRNVILPHNVGDSASAAAPVTPNPRARLANPPSADHCAPRRSRTLSWQQWTRPGTTAVMPCPVGTTGLARWTCAKQGGQYLGSHPDLSGCVSIWLKRLSEKLHAHESIVHLAKDLVHYLSTHHLFGGDIEVHKCRYFQIAYFTPFVISVFARLALPYGDKDARRARRDSDV